MAIITVSSPTTIDQIGALVDLNANGNLKFPIFNATTSALLFSTASQAFVDDGLTYKVSSSFAPFALQTGVSYAIGAIADVGGGWRTNNTSFGNPFTQNFITASDSANGNVTNFATPTLQSPGAAMAIVQLYSPSAVPEPATMGLCGLIALVFAARRRRARA